MVTNLETAVEKMEGGDEGTKQRSVAVTLLWQGGQKDRGTQDYDDSQDTYMTS